MDHGAYKAVDLVSAGPTLAESPVVLDLLTTSLGENSAAAAISMLKSARLDGELGATVHDLLLDAIDNESNDVWDGLIPGSEFDFPVQVKTYGGVYYVWALEYDDVGYFLTLEDAIDYIHSSWDGVREC